VAKNHTNVPHRRHGHLLEKRNTWATLPKACGHVHIENVQRNVLCPSHGPVLRAQRPEVAGDFYLIIIMMIIIIIIILHHGADDYSHMAMQGDLQLGTHEGGY